MRGAGHADQRGGHAADLQGVEVLLGLGRRGAVIVLADHHHGRRLHIADQRQRRAGPITLRVLPRHLAEPVGAHRGVAVGGQDLAGPVDHRLLGDGGAEAVGLADDPGSERAAARTTGHIEMVGVDEPLGDGCVHRAHQVVVVVARIVAVDGVGELIPIGRRAARVGVDHDVAGRGILLVVGGEHRAIGRERTAMDFQDQRVLLRWIEVGRGDQPGVDRLLVEGTHHGHVLDLAELLAGEQVVVEVGEALHLAAAHHGQVGRGIGVALGEGDQAGLAHRIVAAGIGPVEVGGDEAAGQRLQLSVEAEAGDLADAPFGVADDQALAVAGPGQAADAVVEAAGDDAAVPAVGVHDVEAGVFVAAMALVVEAEVGDLPAVRRNGGGDVGADAGGQLGERSVGDGGRIDLALLRVALPVLVAVGGEVDQLAVVAEVDGAAVVILAEGELARGAAVGGDHEQVAVAVLQVAGAVGAVGDAVDDLQRVGPLGAFGLAQRLAERLALVFHQHDECQRLAVRRPGDVVGGIRQRRDLGRAPGPHPADVELRPTRAGGDIGQPRPIRRPARGDIVAIVGGQRRLHAGDRVDQPERGAAIVDHHVLGGAHIGDGAAVGADLRVAGGADAEDVGALEGAAGPLGHLGGGGNRADDGERGSEQGKTHENSPKLEAA